jgi:hypothetical protein
LTAKAAENELGFHPDHLYRLLKSGVVKSEQFNRVWMVDPAEVERIKALQRPVGRVPRTVQ